MMRSPAFRLTGIVPGVPLHGGLSSVAEEDGFFLDEDAQSEHGSEVGPLPASSPAAAHLTRKLHHQGSSKVFDFQQQHQHGHGTPRHADKPKGNADDALSLLVYGLVNVAVSVPCLYGYAGIIYRDPSFQRAMPDLTKLVILSSAIHQLVFTFRSTLSFSIAQVQDAGLIFLSTMATSIASRAANEEEAVATAVVVLSLATACLGIVITIVGRFRLASFVSLIPMPVVAGYLAFIGFFCFAAGLGLSCSKDVSTYEDFAQLNEIQDWILATPAILAGALMTLVSRKSPQWWALPLTITLIPIAFFAVLLIFRISLDDVRESGWVAPLEPPEPFYNVFLRFDFSKVKWALVPKLIITWASMTLLVTFASALDVVAVEMDLGGQELDLDEELKTVGVSNVVSGLFGGYTGSYIFSMTIFTRRTGSRTRWIGVILAVIELLLFIAPFNLMSYIPRFFFAATLIFIAFDLMAEWLFFVAFRVSYREYFTVLLTFFAITFTEDLVIGILIGCLGAVVNFISLYSSIDPVVPAQNTSNVLRDYEARKILHTMAAERIISLKLSGFLFFGSTTLLLSRLRSFLTGDSTGSSEASGSELGGSIYGVALPGQHARNASKESMFSRASLNRTEETPLLAKGDSSAEQAAVHNRTVLGALRKRRSASVNDLPSLTKSYDATLDVSSTDDANVPSPQVDLTEPNRHVSVGGIHEALGPSRHEAEEVGFDEIALLEHRRSGVMDRKTRYLVLDFFSVTGVDATAVSTGLLRIRMLAKANNIKLVFASLSPQFETLFRANQVLGHDDVIVRQTLNDALDYCESEMLDEIKFGREVGNVAQSLKALNTARLLRYPREPSVPPVVFDESTDDPIINNQKKRAEKRARVSLALLVDSFFGWGRGTPSLTPDQSKRLASYFVLRAKRHGSVIFDVGEESDSLYVVLSGEVVLYKVSPDWLALSKRERARIIVGDSHTDVVFGMDRERMQRARYGSMIGDMSFTLQEKRAFGALAERDTTLFVLSRKKLMEMETENPALSVGLYKMIGRSLGMTLVNLQQLAADESAV